MAYHQTRAIPARARAALTLVPMALLLVATAAGAQVSGAGFARDVIVGSGLHLQQWRGEEDLEVREISLPLTLVWPVSRRLSLDVVSGSGWARLDRGTSSSLEGLTDTRIRASYILGEDLALLTAGVSTPTGKSVLDTLEQEVSDYLAQDALAFYTPVFGQGLEANVGLAIAWELGETVLGLGVGYLHKAPFEPAGDGEEYDPGDEIGLTVGVDRAVLDGDGQLTLDVVLTRYGTDVEAGKDVFQSGEKAMAQFLARVRTGGLGWRLQLLERYRKSSTSYEDEDEPRTVSNGNQFEASLSAGMPGSRRLRLGWAGEVRVHGDNGLEQGEALIWGTGPDIDLRLTRACFLNLSARYLRGQIDAAGVSGVDVGGGLWIGL